MIDGLNGNDINFGDNKSYLIFEAKAILFSKYKYPG
jgi:hypothetical protein